MNTLGRYFGVMKGMGVKRLFIMVIICSLALVGCSETFTSKEQLKERIVELEQEIEELERKRNREMLLKR